MIITRFHADKTARQDQFPGLGKPHTTLALLQAFEEIEEVAT